MKHLKKLSVVLMLTTLFSVTFTSCIDNEVSPVVEAIYEAQADLIAAQANVQNAEATKLEAEAAYQLALAAGANADAAYTLEEVEQLKIANAAAQIVVDEAQAQFNIDLAFLVAELEEAGAQIALDYALKYRMYANAATDLLDDKADAVYDLAYAQAQANSSLPLYAIQALETVVANAQFQVEVNEAEIAALQALIDDPNSLPAQVTAWEAEQDALAIERDLKQAEVDAKYAERDNLVAGWDGEDDVRDDFINEYEGYVADSLSLSNQIKVYQDDIDDWSDAVATYEADLTAAEGALTAAETAYDAAWLALGKKDSQGVDVVYPNYFTWSGKTSAPEAIAAGATKYAAPANLQQVYVNARIDYLDASAAWDEYNTDFGLLVGSYNAAAALLAAEQAAFDAGDWAADLATANTALATANTALATAQSAYATAKTNFELDPTGSVITDGPGLASDIDTFFNTIQFDLGNKGIDDLIATTYMQVTSWRETTFGSGQYVPATFAATKYTPATLATKVTALIADNVNYNIVDNTDIYVWNDLVATMPFDDYNQAGTSTDYAANAHSIVSAVPARTQLAVPTAVVFVEVESDDTAVSTLSTFNISTNKLGTNSFSDRAFTSDGKPKSATNTWTAVLAFSDLDAGYFAAWDGLGTMPAADTLTAQAVVWNAKLEVAKRQYAFDNSSTSLDDAQAAYDYQKELFDNGVANLAALKADMDAAEDVMDDAKEAVDNAWTALGVEYAAGDAGDDLKWFKTKAGYVVDATAGYDNDFTTPFVSNTLTINAALYNAEVTFETLDACDADCIQESIDEAQHEIDLIQPALDGILAIIAEMQAQYDIYIATYVPGASTSYAGLDADLKVIYDALSFEIFKLDQELDALDAQYDYVSDMLSWSGGTNLSDVSLQIELAILYDWSQGSYLDSLNDLEDAENALAAALAGNAEDAALIEYYQSVVDVLDQRYENALALAAKYKALMEAALAS